MINYCFNYCLGARARTRPHTYTEKERVRERGEKESMRMRVRACMQFLKKWNNLSYYSFIFQII